MSAGVLYVVNSDDLSGRMAYPDRLPGLTHGACVDDLAVLVLLFGLGFIIPSVLFGPQHLTSNRIS